MATPGFPPPFGAPSGPNTATPSEADIDPGARFPSRYLEGTRRIVSLSAQQHPSLTPQECPSLSPGESVLLPLLCFTIHALNSIGLRVDELHTRMHDLGSPVANSLIGPEIRDLRNSVSDHSRRVALPVLRPTPGSSVPPPPSNPTSGRPSRPSAPLPAVPSNIPPQPAAPPHTRSYADAIHGGTSEFYLAVAANAAARRGKGKGKKSPPTTTASKFPSVVEAATPKRPPPLTSAARRFGHVKPRCKNPTVCPLCAGPQAKAEHRCPNPTCPKGGNLKSVLNCYIASPACCPNCSQEHSASYRNCTAHPIPPPRTAPDAPEAADAAPPASCHPPQSATRQLPSTDPDAIDIQPDEAVPPALASTPPPPGLESPLEFATPRAPLRPAFMGPSGSTGRTGRPQPDGEPSPSPAPRDQSASRR